MTESKPKSHKLTSFRKSTDKKENYITDRNAKKYDPPIKSEITEIELKQLKDLNACIKNPLPYYREQ